MNSKHKFLCIALYGSFLLVVAMLLLTSEKGETELLINSKFNVGLGQFFRYATHLGDGIMYAIIIALFLLIKYYNALLLFLTSVIQTIIVQVMKKIIYPEALRPSAYFENHEGVILNFAEGVKMHSVHSFPSGHTATAFAIAVILTAIIKKPIWSFFFFIAACIAGFSRVYLLQHFFEDVFTGALIGIASALFILFILKKYFPSMSENKNLRRGLLVRK